MQRNLKLKTGVIAATILVCLFGIIGFPKFLGGVGVPTSPAQVKSNIQKNIQLGLDLKGGSHLVLQVQVQDAAKAEADQTTENLRDAARAAGIIIAGFDRNDPASLQETDSIRSIFTASTRRKRRRSAALSPTSIPTGY